jgi:hypothetical protein
MAIKAAPCALLVACALLAGSSTLRAQSAPSGYPPPPPPPASAAPPGAPTGTVAPAPAPPPPGSGAPTPPGAAWGPGYPPPVAPPGPYPYPPQGYQGSASPYGPPPGTVAAPGQLPPGAAAAWGWNTACPPGCGPCKEFPATLKYHEGQPIPAGYALESEMITQAALAGGITLGGLWLISLTAGIGLQDEQNQSSSLNKDYPWPLVFPVAGPFITIATANAEGPVISVLVLDGILQTGALVTFIAGLAAKRDVLVWTGQQGAQVKVDPVVLGTSGGGFGLSARY